MFKLNTGLRPAPGQIQNATSATTSGTDVMILKIFSPKKIAKHWRF
jgi:hypothetical protein